MVFHLNPFRTKKNTGKKCIPGNRFFVLLPTLCLFISPCFVNGREVEFIPTSSLQAAYSYKLVEKGKGFAEQIKESRTIYDIRSEFDLKGATVVLPKDIVLRFTGGCISNGVIEGESLYIDTVTKCFENVRFTNKTSFRNDKACLSWWAKDGDDCTSALEAMQSLLIPTLYLDLHRVYLSHPIVLSTRSRTIIGMESNPRSDWDLSGVTKCTNVLPSRSFSPNKGISAFFVITDSQSEGKIKNICFSGQFKVKYAIFQNTAFFSGEISNNRFDRFALAAIALNCTTEDVRIENNYFTLCQCASWISTTPINEENLLYFDYNNAKGATNLIRYINNYITYCCYGLICQIGSDFQCIRNTIAHTSSYGIYARVYGVANFDGNYFEGCGRSSFWINHNGLTGSLESDKTCDYLLKKHKGENNDFVTGWGVKDGVNQIRPVIYLFGEPTSTWDLKAVIKNSWISNNSIRTLSSEKTVSSSISSGGIDCFACISFGDYIFENNSSPLWKGKRPKYFVYFFNQGKKFRGTDLRGCRLWIHDLPRAFDVSDWFGYNTSNEISKEVKVYLNQ